MVFLIESWSGMLLNSLIGVVVVFGALILLVFMFEMIQYFSIRASKKKVAKATGKSHKEISDVKSISSEEIAAISMALHLYLHEVHDNESNVITIKRIERRYSPWNSKIYGLTNLQR